MVAGLARPRSGDSRTTLLRCSGARVRLSQAQSAAPSVDSHNTANTAAGREAAHHAAPDRWGSGP